LSRNEKEVNVKRLAIVVLLAISGGVLRADDVKRETPTISVSGTGKVSAIPDVAVIQVGVATQASTAQAALSANNEAMNRLHEILKERGVASKDVQTTQIQVTPQYSQPAPRQGNTPQQEFIPRLVGYRVDNTVQVRARHIDKLGPLLDALVGAGANQIHGISFHVDAPEKLLDEARRRAMADAKRKAETLAGEAGVVVGLPITITESWGGMPAPQMPMFAGRGMAAMAAPAPMPVAAGEQELSVSVQVVYELKHAK
jgi:uncharacterized protein YggE